jgi:hypothetical protein
VANALDSVKARVDLVTERDHGAGVQELIDRLIASDLAELNPVLTRHDLTIGTTESGTAVSLPAYDGGLLVAGPSGAGKTRVTTTLLEKLCEAGYQFCVVDPEGDYHEFADAIALRGSDSSALVDEALRVLERPSENAVITLLDLKLEDRPPFLQVLLPRLLQMRSATARPHWIVIDEAHHLLPSKWQPSTTMLPQQLTNVVFVTVHPDHVSTPALQLVETVIVVGPEPQATADAFARARGEPAVRLPSGDDDARSVWLLRAGSTPLRFQGVEPAADRRRHRRKYAEGELGEDRSFYFRGPDGRLNLRAQNLELFAQLADGVDDETWRFHLQRGDVSRWFRTAIKDQSLADEAAEIEARADQSPAESRARMRAAIERRYTASS